jgi:hypothetical protein
MANIILNSEREVRLALNAQWDKLEGLNGAKRDARMNWPGMEDLLVAICNAPIDATDARRAVRECIDAFTGRGHFDPKNYFALLEDVR